MGSEILDILIEGLFEYRRGLLKQVKALEKTIEKYQGLREKKKDIVYDFCEHIFIDDDHCNLCKKHISATIEDEGQD